MTYHEQNHLLGGCLLFLPLFSTGIRLWLICLSDSSFALYLFSFGAGGRLIILLCFLSFSLTSSVMRSTFWVLKSILFVCLIRMLLFLALITFAYFPLDLTSHGWPDPLKPVGGGDDSWHYFLHLPFNICGLFKK